MNNPFKISTDKLQNLIAGYEVWIKSDAEQERYPVIYRELSQKIKDDFLTVDVLSNMTDDELYNKIYAYSRKLEGPAFIRLGEQRIRGDLNELRRNLMYIMTTEDSPFMVAQNILEGEYKIPVFAKAFWSPILLAQFPDVLPNWNNKTENFLKKFGINISTGRLSIAEKYKMLSEAFTVLSKVSQGNDFYNINHLMHYGTVIPEGNKIIEEITSSTEPELIHSIIEKYKVLIRNTGLKDELYKWELLKKYRGRPNLNATDFSTEVKNVDFSNLMYPLAIAVRNGIADKFPEDYRKAFIKLFNDDEDLTSRIKNFNDSIAGIYDKTGGMHGHHHDERTISTYLTYHNPDKYSFFKDSFYRNYCKAMGIKPLVKGEKYAHYLELLSDFIDRHIEPDGELIYLINGFMNEDCFSDENHLILAQDILFHMFENEKEEKPSGEIQINDSKSYFDLSGFQKFRSSFGKDYDSHSDAALWYKETTSKLEYLVELLKEKLNEDIGINYYERAFARAGRGRPLSLKTYIITGFSPDDLFPDKGELFIKLAFHNINTTPVFDIELDQNHNAPEKPFQSIIDELRETSRMGIPVDELFPDTWETLLEKIKAHVSELIFKYRELVKKQSVEEKPELKIMSLNQILYGPPGTGKTYHCVSHSVAIVESKKLETILAEDRKMVKERFEKYRKNGQIEFSTFHQSLGYEDFIEGIKPKVNDDEEDTEDSPLTYFVEDGIFKRLCTEAAFSFIQQNTTVETKKVLDFSTEYDRYIEFVNEQFTEGKKAELQTISGQKLYVESISQKNNLRIRHVNGIRNYVVSKKRLSKISQAFPDLSKVTNINDQFGAEIGGSNASAYWAVLNAIRSQPSESSAKPNISISKKEYVYDEKKQAIESLKNDDYKITNPKPYVLIIDEINRGNVSQIFGELITLIEDDKRLGKNEWLKAILPYSKEDFGVPCNVHIIGTMNTADRSVEALDSALRRRFSFIEIIPKPEKLKPTDDGINLPEILRVLNNRLTVLKDNDHTIGHAWLWDVTNLEQLKTVFGNKILPLLKEYFYNDYEKLGLVLGDAFFKPHEQINSKLFASFTGGNGLSGQYDQSWKYQLKSMNELTIKDFQSLESQNTEVVTGDE